MKKRGLVFFGIAFIVMGGVFLWLSDGRRFHEIVAGSLFIASGIYYIFCGILKRPNSNDTPPAITQKHMGKKFKTVSGEEVQEFDAAVNAALAEGWQLHGSPFNQGGFICQSMIKDDGEEPKKEPYQFQPLMVQAETVPLPPSRAVP